MDRNINGNPLVLFYPATGGDQKVRTLYIEEKLYIALEDIVLALAKDNSATEGTRHGLGKLANAQIDFLDSDESKFFAVGNTDRKEVFVTEPGLYRVVSQDNSPAAKKFQRWVFHEVLPSIRKYGTFPPPISEDSSELSSMAQLLAQNSNILSQEIQAREKLEKETKLRFEETEKRLERVDKKIEGLQFNDINNTHISLCCYLERRKTVKVDKEHLQAMCMKLSLEKNIKHHKISQSSEDIILFAPEIIEESLVLMKL